MRRSRGDIRMYQFVYAAFCVGAKFIQPSCEGEEGVAMNQLKIWLL